MTPGASAAGPTSSADIKFLVKTDYAMGGSSGVAAAATASFVHPSSGTATSRALVVAVTYLVPSDDGSGLPYVTSVTYGGVAVGSAPQVRAVDEIDVSPTESLLMTTELWAVADCPPTGTCGHAALPTVTGNIVVTWSGAPLTAGITATNYRGVNSYDPFDVRDPPAAGATTMGDVTAASGQSCAPSSAPVAASGCTGGVTLTTTADTDGIQTDHPHSLIVAAAGVSVLVSPATFVIVPGATTSGSDAGFPVANERTTADSGGTGVNDIQWAAGDWQTQRTGTYDFGWTLTAAGVPLRDWALAAMELHGAPQIGFSSPTSSALESVLHPSFIVGVDHIYSEDIWFMFQSTDSLCGTTPTADTKGDGTYATACRSTAITPIGGLDYSLGPSATGGSTGCPSTLPDTIPAGAFLVCLPKGTSGITLPITLNQDDFDEDDEVFHLSLLSDAAGGSSAYVNTTTDDGTFTILDDDIYVCFTGVSGGTATGSGPESTDASFTLTMSEGWDATKPLRTISYYTREFDADDTVNIPARTAPAENLQVGGSPNWDFDGPVEASPTTVNLPNDGTTVSAPFTIDVHDDDPVGPPTGDGRYEYDEPFEILLAVPASEVHVLHGGTSSTPACRMVWTITNDDTKPNVVFVDPAPAGEDVQEDVGTVTTQIQLSKQSQVPVNITVIPQDLEATRIGSASDPADYTFSPITVHFDSDDSGPLDVPVTILDDSCTENTQRFRLRLQNPDDPLDLGIGSPNAYTIAIHDNDNLPTVFFDTSTDSGTEPFTDTLYPNKVRVSLSALSCQVVTVRYSLNVLSTATNNVDYQLPSGTTNIVLTFPQQNLTQTIPFRVLADSIAEPDETVVLTLSSPSNAFLEAGPTARTTHTYTILNDDHAVASVTAVSVLEQDTDDDGTTSLVYTIALSNASSVPVTVAWAAEENGATNGARVSDVDFDSATGNSIFTACAAAPCAAGATSQTVTVVVHGDPKFELDETMRLRITSVTAGTADPLRSQAAGTVANDDARPRIFVVDSTVFEPDTGSTRTLSIPVKLTNPSYDTICFSVVIRDRDDLTTTPDSFYDFALEGSDFTTPPGSATGCFTPGTNTTSLDYNVLGDTTFERDETFRVILTPTGGSYDTNLLAAGYDLTGVGTIRNDDDVPFFSVRSADLLGTPEAAGTTDFIIEMVDDTGTPTGVGLPMRVNITSREGAACDPTDCNADGTGIYADYAALSTTTILFAAGETGKSISVDITADPYDEDDETFQVFLSDASGALLDDDVVPTFATATILDDDLAPTVIVDAASTDEGDAMVFTVHLSQRSGKVVLVNFTTADNTARDLGRFPDYVTVSAGTPRQAAFARMADPSTTVSVNTRPFVVTCQIPANLHCGGDFLHEDAETFFLVPSGTPQNTVTDALSTGVGTIVDHDPTPEFSVSSVTVDEAAGTADFNVTMGAYSGVDATIRFSTSDGTARSSTTSPAYGDYDAATSVLCSLPAEAAFYCIIPITIVDDAWDENNEAFTVTLSTPTGVGLSPTAFTATGTIQDNDVPPIIVVTQVAGFDAQATEAAPLTFQLALVDALGDPAESELPVSINWATNGGTGSFPAEATDFIAASNTVTFTAHTSTNSFQVTTTSDTIDEDDEAVAIAFSGLVNADPGSAASATGYIIDDDGPPALTLAVTSPFEGNSGSPSVQWTASVPAGTTERTIGLSCGVADGTPPTHPATGAAAAGGGADYRTTVSNCGALTPGNGYVRTLFVQIFPDTTYEYDETLVVTVTPTTAGTISQASVVTAGLIRNDDAAPFVNIGDLTQAEGNGPSTAFNFPITLRTATAPAGALVASGRPTSVTIHTSIGGVSPADPTGVSDLDYASIDAPPGVVVNIPAGTTTVNAQVSVLGDTKYEDDETLLVDGDGTSLSEGQAGDLQGLGTITNDDSPPVLTVGAASVQEGDASTSSLVFLASLDVVSGLPVSFHWATSDGPAPTAVAGSDYSATSGDILIPAGELSTTFAVDVIGDLPDEADEQFTVTVTALSGATASSATAIGSILDDDSPRLLVLDGPAAFLEGDSGTTDMPFTVRIDRVSYQDIDVLVDTSNIQAVAGVDYTALDDVLVHFPAGSTADQTFNVPILGDLTVEKPAAETFRVTIHDATGGATILNLGRATGTIIDDDVSAFVVQADAVDEGNSGTTTLDFIIFLTKAGLTAGSVNYTVVGIDTESDDFDLGATPSTGKIDFPIGVTGPFHVIVNVHGDTIYEPDETVRVFLSDNVTGELDPPGDVSDALIRNDDAPPLATLELDAPTPPRGVPEGMSATITVRLATLSELPVHVDLGLFPGNPPAVPGVVSGPGTDANLAATSIDIDPLTSTGTVFFGAVNDDPYDEPDEEVRVTIESITGATESGAQEVVPIILDQSPEPTVGLALSDDFLDENGEAGTVTASLSAISAFDVTVGLTFGGHAAAVGDYTRDRPNIVIPAGSISSTMTLTPFLDGIYEGAEGFDVSVGTLLHALPGVTGQTVSGFIVDGDPLPRIGLFPDSGQTDVDEESGTLIVYVCLDAVSGLDTPVELAIDPSSTATTPGDFTIDTLTVVIPAGNAGDPDPCVPVTITGTPDALFELQRETIVLTIADFDDAEVDLAHDTATLNVVSLDPPPNVSLTLLGTDLTEVEGSPQPSIQLRATLDAVSGLPAHIPFVLDGSTADNLDFTTSALFIDIPAGILTGTLTVTLLYDATDELTETIVLTIDRANLQYAAAPAPAPSAAIPVFDDDIPVLAIGNAPTINEPDTDAPPTFVSFQVTLDRAPAQDVTVLMTTADGTATDGEDYVGYPATAPFTVRVTRGALVANPVPRVQVRGDPYFESDETFTASLSSPVNAMVGPGLGTGNALILNNDARPILDVRDVSVTEGLAGCSALTFNVILTPGTLTDVTVGYHMVFGGFGDPSTGDATAGIDIDALADGAVLFHRGDTQRPVTTCIHGDDLDERNERLGLRISGPSTNARIGDQDAIGTIVDDDTATVEVIESNFLEGDSGVQDARVTARLSVPSDRSIDVTWATQPGTATEGTDYVRTSGNLHFGAGQTVTAFTIGVRGDLIREGDETVFVTLSGPTNGAALAANLGLLTILDNEGTPRFILVGPDPILEGDSGTTPIVFRVILAPASADDLSVAYRVGTGSATSGSDYDPLAAGILSFPTGITEQDVTVNVRGDRVIENDEEVALELFGAGSTPIGIGTATGSIIDDDIAFVQVDGGSQLEGTTGDRNLLPFAFALSAPVDRPVSVPWSTRPCGATETTAATPAAGDYIGAAGAVDLPAMSTAPVSVNIVLIGDVVDEAHENVCLVLGRPSVQRVSPLGDGVATGLLLDDEGPPTFAIVGATVIEHDVGVQQVAITVRMAPATDHATSVHLGTQDFTADTPNDYGAVSQNLGMPTGFTELTVNVPVNGDVIDERDVEEFRLVLDTPGGGAVVDPLAGTALVRILDDDTARVIVPDTEVAEGDSGERLVPLRITLTNPSDRDIVLNYGTAPLEATLNVDYRGVAGGPITIPAFSNDVVVSPTVIADALDEPDRERFQLTVTTATNAQIARPTGIITIRDDDPPPTILFDEQFVSEGDAGLSAAQLPIRLSAPSAQTIRVEYRSQQASARDPSDYRGVSGTFYFLAGQTQLFLPVNIVGDFRDEPLETFTIEFSDPVLALLPVDSLAVHILDDDDSLVPILEIVDINPVEGTGDPLLVRVEVHASQPYGQPVSVSFATQDGTAVSGSDYQAASGTLTLPPGETVGAIYIAVTGDDEIEGTESFNVNLAEPINGVIADATGVVTIVDDDPAPYASDRDPADPSSHPLDLPDVSLSDNGGTLRVTRDPASTTVLRVRMTAIFPGGSTTFFVDIPAGERSALVNLPSSQTTRVDLLSSEFYNIGSPGSIGLVVPPVAPTQTGGTNADENRTSRIKLVPAGDGLQVHRDGSGTVVVGYELLDADGNVVGRGAVALHPGEDDITLVTGPLGVRLLPGPGYTIIGEPEVRSTAETGFDLTGTVEMKQDGNTVTLSWPPVVGAKGYQVWQERGAWVLIGTVEAPSLNVVAGGGPIKVTYFVGDTLVLGQAPDGTRAPDIPGWDPAGMALPKAGIVERESQKQGGSLPGWMPWIGLLLLILVILAVVAYYVQKKVRAARRSD